VCLKGSRFRRGCRRPADLAAFTSLSLGYVGLQDALGKGQVAFHGSERAISLLCLLMRLPQLPTLKQFRFAPFPTSDDRLRETEHAVVNA